MKKIMTFLIMLIVGLALCGCQGLELNYEIDLCNTVIESRIGNTWFSFVNDDIVKFEGMTDANTLSHTNKIVTSFSGIGEILAIKYQDAIYVIVAKPVIVTGDYIISIEEMKKAINDNNMSLKISAKYIKTDSNESTAQIEWFPFSIAKTDLKELPNTIEVYWREQVDTI